VTRREEKEAWAAELVKQLEKEKKVRMTLEDERRALAAFVSKFDSLGLGGGNMLSSSKPVSSLPSSSVRAKSTFGSRVGKGGLGIVVEETESPIRIELKNQPSLLEQTPEDEWSLMDDVSFEIEVGKTKVGGVITKRAESPLKEVFASKENIPV